MANSGNTAEVTAIEDAYADRIRMLYGVLATNLVDSAVSEQQSVQRFVKGLTVARRAKELALGALPGGTA